MEDQLSGKLFGMLIWSFQSQDGIQGGSHGQCPHAALRTGIPAHPGLLASFHGVCFPKVPTLGL